MVESEHTEHVRWKGRRIGTMETANRIRLDSPSGVLDLPIRDPETSPDYDEFAGARFGPGPGEAWTYQRVVTGSQPERAEPGRDRMAITVPIRPGPPAAEHETVATLQAAIELAYGTPGHIHEGPINPATGYPSEYYVCDGEGS
jgi:hypothetical protein